MLNTAQFSAAKDLAETKALQALAVTSDGFNDFKKKAYEEVTSIGRDQWLRVEMDSCIRGAVMGESWRKIEESKDMFPYWVYRGEMDDREREEHEALEGLIFRIGDPEGDSICPPNDWNCRCRAEPADEGDIPEGDQVSEGKDYLDKDDPENGKPYVDEDFRYNPGKSGPMPNDSSYSEVLSSANQMDAELLNLPKGELMADILDLESNGGIKEIEQIVFRADTKENYNKIKANPDQFIETNLKGLNKNPAKIYFMSSTEKYAELYGENISSYSLKGKILDLADINAQKFIAKDYEHYLFEEERGNIEAFTSRLKYITNKKERELMENKIEEYKKILDNKEKYINEPERLKKLNNQITSDYDNGFIIKNICEKYKLDGFVFDEDVRGRTFGLIERPLIYNK